MPTYYSAVQCLILAVECRTINPGLVELCTFLLICENDTAKLSILNAVERIIISFEDLELFEEVLDEIATVRATIEG